MKYFKLIMLGFIFIGVVYAVSDSQESGMCEAVRAYDHDNLTVENLFFIGMELVDTNGEHVLIHESGGEKLCKIKNLNFSLYGAGAWWRRLTSSSYPAMQGFGCPVDYPDAKNVRADAVTPGFLNKKYPICEDNDYAFTVDSLDLCCEASAIPRCSVDEKYLSGSFSVRGRAYNSSWQNIDDFILAAKQKWQGTNCLVTIDIKSSLHGGSVGRYQYDINEHTGKMNVEGETDLTGIIDDPYAKFPCPYGVSFGLQFPSRQYSNSVMSFNPPFDDCFWADYCLECAWPDDWWLEPREDISNEVVAPSDFQERLMH